MNFAHKIAQTLSIPQRSAQITLKLLDEGATVPFLARYRKDQTGGLDEEQIRSVQQLAETLKNLETRRSSIIKTLSELGIFQGRLKDQIESAKDLNELEDLYLPHKPKRKTRATTARALGLEPLAEMLIKQPKKSQPYDAAKAFVKGEVKDVEAALSGARDIVAETAAEHPKVRQLLRNKAERFARLVASKKKKAEDPKETYRSYYDFNTPLNRIQPHQTLAIDRAEKEKVLKVSVEIPERDWKDALKREFRPFQHSAWGQQLQLALDDAGKRLLLPAIERELRKKLTEQAQSHAIAVFGSNLESLLMVPPLSERTVLAIDPGFRSGCKLAVVDPTGKLLTTDTIYPHPPQKREEDSLKRLTGSHQKAQSGNRGYWKWHGFQGDGATGGQVGHTLSDCVGSGGKCLFG